MKKAKFYVSESPSFEGYYDPSVNWNGFACPYFTLEVLDKIVEHFQDELRRDDFTRGSIYSPETGQLFSINNAYWCWQVDGHEIKELAVKFSRVLKTWLSPVEFESMVNANFHETDDSICHSHDHCDANMAMYEAYKLLTGKEIDTDNDSELDFIHEAWDLAKSKNFYHLPTMDAQEWAERND